VIYRDELAALAEAPGGPEVIQTLTRSQPPGWTGYARRVDGGMLADAGWPPSTNPKTFVCGPTPFVEAVASALVLLGHPAASVKTERFGPTGG
jgi:ferredoxin-NADP reductase